MKQNLTHLSPSVLAIRNSPKPSLFSHSLFSDVVSNHQHHRRHPTAVRCLAPLPNVKRHRRRLPTSFRHVQVTKGKKEVDKIGDLFDVYANKSLDMIDPEGIVSLCSHLGVDHTDVRILMLAWKMKAEKQGYFSREEWQRGLKDLNTDTIAKLKKALPSLEKELMATPKFEDFYGFAFQYCLTEDRQKSVDIETVCELLNLVLGPEYHSQVDILIKYLQVQSEYRVLNADQWRHLYRFCKEISFPDLEDYDSDQAWPVIIDNFVEWMKVNKQS